MKLIYILFFVLFGFSCVDDDLEKKVDDLENEIQKVTFANDLLSLKNELYSASYEGKLLKESLQDELGDILYWETGEKLLINKGLLNRIEFDKSAWRSFAHLCDSTIIELGYCSSSLDFSADDLILNPNDNAPLSLQIKVSTPVLGKFSVRVLGQDGPSSDMIGHFSNYTREHLLGIVGLYPNYKNQIELTFKSKTGIVRCIDTVSVTTSKVDFDLPDIEIVKQYAVATPNTVFFVNSLSSNVPYMIDVFGKVRWYSNGLFEGPKFGLQRLSNGNVIYGKSGYGQGAFVEFSMMGKLIRKFTVYPEFENIHHDVCVLPNGNLIATVNKTGISTIHDILIEVERVSGQIVNVWDFRDILPVDRYTFRKITDEPCWLHINGVAYDKNDNTLIVSGQAQGVMKVTWDKKIKWILAPHKGWPSKYESYLLKPKGNNIDFDWTWGQHCPVVTPEGNLLMFDNGYGRNFSESTKYSRGVEYKITDLDIEQVWEYGKGRGSELFSPVFSGVQYLEESKSRLLVGGSLKYDLHYTDSLNNSVSPNTSLIGTRIIEVEGNDNVCFEMIFKSSKMDMTFRAQKMKLYN